MGLGLVCVSIVDFGKREAGSGKWEMTEVKN